MRIGERLSRLAASKRVIGTWYAFVILFFLFFVLLPTVYVLSYGITSFDEVQQTISAPPPSARYTEVTIGDWGAHASMSLPDGIDVTKSHSFRCEVSASQEVYLNYSIYRSKEGGGGQQRVAYFYRNLTFPQDAESWVNITGSPGYGELRVVGEATQNLTLRYANGSYVDSWEDGIALWAGEKTALEIIESAVGNSFLLAAIVTLISFVTGLPMAWLLVKKEFRGKRYLDTLIDMPLAIPTAALGFSTALFWAVTPELHPIGSLRLTSSPFILLILLHVVFAYPYMVRSLGAILHEIDVNYETAAATLGAPPLTVARTITLPLFRAGLVTGIILCFARSLSETGGTMAALAMLTPYIAEQAYPVHTGPTLIGAWKHAGVYEPQLAFTAIILVIASLLLLVAVKIVIMRFKLPMRRVFPGAERILSRGIIPALKDRLAILFMVIVLLVPSFFIFTFAACGGGTVHWSAIWEAMGYSFLVAGVVTGINLVFGVPLAIYIVRGRSRSISHTLDVLVNVPLIVPTAALGISLGLFWGSMHIGVVLLLVISAHIAFTFPLVVRNVAGALEELDPAYEETARTLGAKPLFVFKKVIFPSIKFSILAGAIMAFTRSLGETGATLAVAKGANTAPVLIVDMVRAGDHYSAAVACIILIAIAFVTMLAMRIVTRRGTGK
ncbi:MAG: ABC transporter permease subunit [Candidatus Thermoplasmatota archaeon]